MRHGVCGCRDGGVAERHEAEQGRSEDGVRALVGWGGVSGTARQQGSEGAAAAQRGSERTRAQVPARAQSREGRVSEGEREEREKGSGERNKSQGFDLVQTQDFQLKLKKF